MPPLLFRELPSALGGVALATGAGACLRLWTDPPNLSMVFLPSVLFCAVRFGTRAAVMAALLAAAAYDFFFIEPRYALSIADSAELLALAIFLAVAVLTGSLTGRLRRQTGDVTAAAAKQKTVFAFSQHIASAVTRDDVLTIAARYLHALVRTDVAFFVPVDGSLSLRCSEPGAFDLDENRAAAADRAFRTGETVTWRVSRDAGPSVQFLPLVTPRAIVGVCGLVRDLGSIDRRDDDEVQMTTAALDQVAIALDRILLIEGAVRAAWVEKNATLQDAFLASLSHDLRTPLATVTGAASSLRELGDRMSPEQRGELLLSIESEGARLARLVGNLRDITRIESGALKARHDWVDVKDVARSAVGRARRADPATAIDLNAAPDLPFVHGDAPLLEQALFNLIDNAQKHAEGHAVAVHLRREGDSVLLSVTDQGPGIKPAELGRVFDKFYRGGRSDSRRAGTGLGLAICRGFVASMGGTIEAQSPAVRRRGTRIIIRLPVAARAIEDVAL